MYFLICWACVTFKKDYTFEFNPLPLLVPNSELDLQ